MRYLLKVLKAREKLLSIEDWIIQKHRCPAIFVPLVAIHLGILFFTLEWSTLIPHYATE